MELLRKHLAEGQVIPAQPLALDAQRKFSEKHQRAITRYYMDAGVGGLAVGPFVRWYGGAPVLAVAALTLGVGAALLLATSSRVRDL